MPSAEPIQLIVGLGNPGPQYTDTRHNAGVWLVEQLAAEQRSDFRVESRFFGRVAKITLAGRAIWLLLPDTFMNLSGQAVLALSHYYRIPLNAVLVAHDELDLPPGISRFKQSGGHGGHNGLRDIIQRLSNPDFHRLRIGIGHPGDRHHVVDYVLGKPSIADRDAIMASIEQACWVMPQWLGDAPQKAVQALHRFQGNCIK